MLKIFSAVLMLQTGFSRSRVDAIPQAGSNIHTKITKFLSVFFYQYFHQFQEKMHLICSGLPLLCSDKGPLLSSQYVWSLFWNRKIPLQSHCLGTSFYTVLYSDLPLWMEGYILPQSFWIMFLHRSPFHPLFLAENLWLLLIILQRILVQVCSWVFFKFVLECFFTSFFPACETLKCLQKALQNEKHYPLSP